MAEQENTLRYTPEMVTTTNYKGQAQPTPSQAQMHGLTCGPSIHYSPVSSLPFFSELHITSASFSKFTGRYKGFTYFTEENSSDAKSPTYAPLLKVS